MVLSVYRLFMHNSKGKAFSLRSRLRYSGNSHIDFRNLVPGGIVRHSGPGQIENALEGADRIRGGGAVYAVRRYGGDGRIVAGNAVQLGLELTYLVAGGNYI